MLADVAQLISLLTGFAYVFFSYIQDLSISNPFPRSPIVVGV